MPPHDQILARMYILLVVIGLVPVAVMVQVGRIVAAEGADLRATSARQTRAAIPLPAMRGAILDRAGRALAVNTARYDVALDPTMPGFAAADSTLFATLAAVTGRPADVYRRRVAERASPQYVRLVRGLAAPQREALDALDVPGLIVTPRFARRYHYGTTASHVLGHVGADGRGLAGLELRYDEHLHGTPGRRAVQRDRRGRIKAVVGGAAVAPRHGETLRLTIDLVRQAVLEDELARGVRESGARRGTALAMDPRTGALLALANVPTYDPNRPAAFSDAARRNRALTDQIEPGSTFKLISAVAALEEGVVTLADSVETGDGWAVFAGYTMRDVRAYGTITFADALVKSSNVGVAKTAARLDPGAFYQYARNFGFGQPTYVDLPGEVAGVLKNPSEWSRTSLTSMSIGYEIAATPLQLLTAYAALANGGVLVEPHVVAARATADGVVTWRQRPDSVRRAMAPATAAALLPVFERVVSEGTATRAALDGVPVAGKTGTALKVGARGYDRTASRASFVGFFPADDPAVALLVVLDEPRTSLYGGAVAAPVFRRVARRWAHTLPPVMDRLVARADSAATPASPDAAPDATARLAAMPDSLMPDLAGLSTRDALRWLRARGVAAQVRGTGVVTAHAPAAGAPLPARVTLRCQ